MTTTKRLSTLAALAFTIALGGVASAQDVAPVESGEPGDTQIVEVAFGGYEFPLVADEPVQACILSREDSLDAVNLVYRLFVREPDGSFSSLGRYPTPAIGAFAGALAGDCLNLDGAVNAN